MPSCASFHPTAGTSIRSRRRSPGSRPCCAKPASTPFEAFGTSSAGSSACAARRMRQLLQIMRIRTAMSQKTLQWRVSGDAQGFSNARMRELCGPAGSGPRAVCLLLETMTAIADVPQTTPFRSLKVRRRLPESGHHSLAGGSVIPEELWWAEFVSVCHP